MKKDKEQNIFTEKDGQKIALGTFITQPISQADSRQEKTNVALPNDENVEINREWIEENKK